MQADLVLEGGRFFREGALVSGDIAIRGGRIVALGAVTTRRAAEILPLDGAMILPGFVDVHVHFRDPGLTHKEDWERGSRAAVTSGVTTVFDMPNTIPPVTDRDTLEAKAAIARRRSHVNFGLLPAATGDNLDELRRLAESGRIPAVKAFLGVTTGGLVLEDWAAFERLLDQVEVPVVVHAESAVLMERARRDLGSYRGPDLHRRIRTVEAAASMVEQALAVASSSSGRLHVAHVSSRDEARLILGAEGTGVTWEVAPHHAYLEPEPFEAEGRPWMIQTNPPVRGAPHGPWLREAMAEGVVPMVASDHAPHTLEEKSCPYPDCPSGVPGVETLPRLLLAEVQGGRLPLATMVAMTSTTPARVFGLEGRGVIEEGAWADLVVVDPSARCEPLRLDSLVGSAGWSPFEGRLMAPPPAWVLVEGRVVAEYGALVRHEVRGRDVFERSR